MGEDGGAGSENAEYQAGLNGGARPRRPVPERTEPLRGFLNLYAPGKADRFAPRVGAPPNEPPAAPEPAAASGGDATGRVIREGYRIVEDNLRRGRQAAAQLRGVRRDVVDAATRLEPQKLVSAFSQTFLDPALTQQFLELARSWISLLGVGPATSATVAPAQGSDSASAERVPLHPQERSDYARDPISSGKLLRLRQTGEDEWLGDLEIDGKVRRVHLRAVDGDL